MGRRGAELLELLQYVTQRHAGWLAGSASSGAACHHSRHHDAGVAYWCRAFSSAPAACEVAGARRLVVAVGAAGAPGPFRSANDVQWQGASTAALGSSRHRNMVSSSVLASQLQARDWQDGGRDVAAREPRPSQVSMTLAPHGDGAVPDLALQNAPLRLLQLIGDPRSGVADDVASTNPFGAPSVSLSGRPRT
jgi:hypothetical protein